MTDQIATTEVGRSLGLLDPAVATANAWAAGEKLHLMIEYSLK